MEEISISKQQEHQASLQEAKSKPTPKQGRDNFPPSATTEEDHVESPDAGDRKEIASPGIFPADRSPTMSSSSEEEQNSPEANSDGDRYYGPSPNISFPDQSRAIRVAQFPMPTDQYNRPYFQKPPPGLSSLSRFPHEASYYGNNGVSTGLTDGVAADLRSYCRPRTAKPPDRKRKPRTGKQGKQRVRWNDMFDRLVEFQRLHGHCLVPNRYVNDPSLGAWVSTQRRHYKILMSGDSNETTPMTPERVARLSSIGFAWATADPRHVPWEVRFKELLEYKEKHGDCVVPIGYKENPQLSNWVSAQRQDYKLYRQGKKCRITPERIQALDAVGFVWVAQRGMKRKAEAEEAEQGSPSVAANRFGEPNFATSLSQVACRFPPFGLKQEIPPALLSHIESLLAANEQSNRPQVPEIGAAAARMMEALLDQQNRIAATMPPARFTDTVNRPSREMAYPAASAKSALNPVGRLGVENSDDDEDYDDDDDDDDGDADDNYLTTKAKGSSRSTIPYNKEIITKYVTLALLQDSAFRVDPTLVEAAVQKIHGIIERPNDRYSTFSKNDTREHTRQMPDRPPFRFKSPLSAKARTGRNEPVTEASKFGVALQVGEIVKKCDPPNADVAPFDPCLRSAHGHAIGRSSAAGYDGPQSVVSSFARRSSEEMKQTPQPTTGYSRDEHLDIDADDASANKSGDAFEATKTDQSDDGGIFSDAEED